jgi:hypothetical protein
MNMQRVNNFRMGGYAALAAGLINLQYQSGSSGNLSKSLVLIIPGALILIAGLFEGGRNLLQRKGATAVGLTVGGLLLVYSFIL